MAQDRSKNEQKQPETQLVKAPVKRYLVVDVDNTIFLDSRNDEGCLYEKFLSPRMIQFAKLGNYDGFYICTHRSLSNLSAVVKKFLDDLPCPRYLGQSDRKEWEEQSKIREKNFEDIFLVNIIKNFSEATGLPCMGVSTADQFREKQLGTGFKTYLEPFENHILNSGNKDKPELPVIISHPWPEKVQTYHAYRTGDQTINGKKYFIPDSVRIIQETSWPERDEPIKYESCGIRYISTCMGPRFKHEKDFDKNNQLETIADDALAKNPSGYSLLDFVDDNQYVLLEACEADKEIYPGCKLASRLSDQVFLRVLKHDAGWNSVVSKPLRSTRGYWPSDVKSSSEFSAISADTLLRTILESFIHETEGLNVLVRLVHDYLDYDDWFATLLKQMKLFSPAFFNELLSDNLKSVEYKKQNATCSNTDEIIERLAQNKLIRRFPLQFLDRAVAKAAEFKNPKEVYRKEDCAFFGLWKTSVLDKTEYSISINDGILERELNEIAAAYKVEEPRSQPVRR